MLAWVVLWKNLPQISFGSLFLLLAVELFLNLKLKGIVFIIVCMYLPNCYFTESFFISPIALKHSIIIKDFSFCNNNKLELIFQQKNETKIKNFTLNIVEHLLFLQCLKFWRMFYKYITVYLISKGFWCGRCSRTTIE